MKLWCSFDIDGVVVTGKQCQKFRSSSPPFEEDLKARLSVLIKRAERVFDAPVGIVLSSTWRHYMSNLDRAIQELHSIGALLVGVTNRSTLANERRGDEISEWLQSHIGLGWRRFVILDDDSDMSHLMKHLVKTDTYSGLSMDNVTKALEILGDEELQAETRLCVI